MRLPRLLIAGTHSGVGKTTVSLALMAAFRARGKRVQPFKAGPDFIDPGHHTMICGRPSRNLDGWVLGRAGNQNTFARAAHGADLAIVEGMMGLFDGAHADGEQGSTAELAKQLDLPVLLVVDGSAMARSAAAMVKGYAEFDEALNVAGVLFNRVHSEGHYRLLREAVDAATDIPVVGYVKPNEAITIPDRHLGLRMALEQNNAGIYAALGQAIQETVDLDQIEELARTSAGIEEKAAESEKRPAHPQRGAVRIGVAHDPAFCFYYQDNLDLLQTAGGELIWFSPMHDSKLAEVAMVYLGGGYPEIYAESLQTNTSMRRAIREFAEQGGVVYAECGGLMYLTQSLKDFEGRSFDMVGIFPGETAMNRQSFVLGYREAEIKQPCVLGERGTKVRGHEFHYSSYIPGNSVTYSCALTDSQSRKCGQDGLVKDHVVALYTHLHFGSQPSIAQALVDAARAHPGISCRR